MDKPVEEDKPVKACYERIECNRCGTYTARCNMHHHRLTINCIKKGDPNDPEVKKDEEKRLAKKDYKTQQRDEQKY